MSAMIRSKYAVAIFMISLPLFWNILLASSFHLSSFRLRYFPLGCSSRNSVYLRNAINDSSENRAIEETVSACGYSILLADSREKALAIKRYRFGGPTVEEYMKSNPDLISRQDALRSLTRTFDDRGIQKIFDRDGAAGESVQFYAIAGNDASSVSAAARDNENIQVSPFETHGVLGSVEAVREYKKKGDNRKILSIELKNLSVHKDARRRGIGKALTVAVQEYARCQVSILKQQESQSYSGIVHLIVESDNHGAIGLYKGTGFVLDNPEAKDELCELTWYTEG